MTKFEQIKPYVTGIVIGLIAAPVIAFSFGWIVTTGSMETSVQEAKLQVLAAACADRATAYRTAENITTDISGWQERDAREQIAGRFVVNVDQDGIEDDDLIEECADLLDV